MRSLLVWCLFTSLCLAEEAPDPIQRFATEFVSITPGQGDFPASFRQGSEDHPASQPIHEVKLSRPFHMAKYEVPQNLYELVMGANPSRWKGPRNSVEMLTVAEARQFCEKLTLRMRERQLLTADEVIRLPTEVEWEYCCRAGTTSRYSFGDMAQAAGDVGKIATTLDKYGWHTGNAAGNDPPVGALAPNPWGLYDMHGYLWEICSDRWQPNYSEAAATNETAVVVRGGSWKDTHALLSSATRQKYPAAAKDDAVGFRCVKSSSK